MQMGDRCELEVLPAAALANEGEAVTYWQMQVQHLPHCFAILVTCNKRASMKAYGTGAHCM